MESGVSSEFPKSVSECTVIFEVTSSLFNFTYSHVNESSSNWVVVSRRNNRSLVFNRPRFADVLCPGVHFDPILVSSFINSYQTSYFPAGRVKSPVFSGEEKDKFSTVLVQSVAGVEY